MKFLVDNQLPPALARFISEDLEGEAVHVTDVGLRDSDDAQIWDYAGRHGYVLVTKDDDFVSLHSMSPSGSLLWVRLGNCRRSRVLDVFRGQWRRILTRFENGETFVELR